MYKFLLKKITGKDVPVLIVDTGLKEIPGDETSNLILGDNSKREFSGYQTGFDHLKQNGKINENTILFFVNDTFNVNYAGADYLALFLKSKAKKEILRGHLVGYIDRLGEDVEVVGRRGRY